MSQLLYIDHDVQLHGRNRRKTVITYDYRQPVGLQLHRRRVHHNLYLSDEQAPELLEIACNNSSLMIDLGYAAFKEAAVQTELTQIIKEVDHHGIGLTVPVTTNSDCTFLTFHELDMHTMADLNCSRIEDLTLFNNRLIDYQTSLIERVVQQPVFTRNLLVYNSDYRFGVFKAARECPDQLSELFQTYIDCLLEARVPMAPLTAVVPMWMVEQEIGCHFLGKPGLFYELVGFNVLKGNINE
jgi:hypothetical protein